MPPGPSGPDQIWDTGYTGILGQYVSGVSVFPDSVIVSTPDAIYYYKENTDSLSLTGYENRKSRISYDTPRLIRPSDMQYGDSVSGYYSGRGSYCGRLDLDISGFQYSVAVNEDAGRHDLNMELTRQPTGNVVVVHVEAAGLHDSRKVYKEHV